MGSTPSNETFGCFLLMVVVVVVFFFLAGGRLIFLSAIFFSPGIFFLYIFYSWLLTCFRTGQAYGDLSVTNIVISILDSLHVSTR